MFNSDVKHFYFNSALDTLSFPYEVFGAGVHSFGNFAHDTITFMTHYGKLLLLFRTQRHHGLGKIQKFAFEWPGEPFGELSGYILCNFLQHASSARECKVVVRRVQDIGSSPYLENGGDDDEYYKLACSPRVQVEYLRGFPEDERPRICVPELTILGIKQRKNREHEVDQLKSLKSTWDLIKSSLLAYFPEFQLFGPT